MSISNSYLVLNDKNIQRLQNFNLDIDNIFTFSRNGDLNLYFRAEKILSEIKTEFNQFFYLSGFVNCNSKDRTYEKFFSVADYNIDIKHQPTELGGNIYRDNNDLKMIQFEGFIQIPNRVINESEQKILLDEYSSYKFLGNENGYPNTDFILNFSFPKRNLEIPIRNTYILANDILKLAEMKLITIPNPKYNNDKDRIIEELQTKITELENQLQAQQSAVNSQEVLPVSNLENYNPTERETHLLMIDAMAKLLTNQNFNVNKYIRGKNINKKQISEDITEHITKVLNTPETTIRSAETIRKRLNEALKLNE
ncbi:MULTISPECIES: hypothetical protein [unclassified Pasteurella]|uniref:hypothetical protein n=1 Tax=unclassified Pasteurella TaxID=2621516 RepID=UPI0010747438|nr:hypothetical protein [Pasteurella sp. 19428wF3_WM03]TFU53165.1 hypothetical protein E4T92_01840 [Pasteurella sp. WM03]